MSALTLAFLGLLAVPAAAQHEPRLRQVDLSADVGAIHALSVVGAPHLTTTIRIPDSFAVSNVACGGDCIDARALDEGKSVNLGANWILDVRPKERTLHLWPANLPSRENPPSAFRSNIYVGLDGGDVLNVAISLMDPANPQARADAVVDVVLAKGLAYSSRMQQERAQVLEAASNKARQQEQNKLHEQLREGTHCREVRWSLPHRHERVVVRLRQLCHTGGDLGLRWLVFGVENRGHVPLTIGSVRLLPEDEAEETGGGFLEAGTSLRDAQLAPGGKTQGIAGVQLTAARLRRQSWALHVEAQEPRPERLRIGHILF